MEITIGAKVEDKNGELVGTVNNILRDTWTSEITKFSVKTELVETDLFYSPGEVSETSETRVKLNVALGEVNSSIQYGAKVFDKNHQYIGTVDYAINDSLTGEIKKFKVKTKSAVEFALFSVADVEKIVPGEVDLKITAE
jgi:sporulation protein YlmC with PRC-barrel domain